MEIVGVITAGRVSGIGEGIRQNRHDRGVFVEFAGIDLIEGVSGCMVVVKVKATVLRGGESRDTFCVERVHIGSDFAGAG
jgi:hypothetical protein